MPNEKLQDILFEYLKNIIYSPEKAELDINAFPDDYRDLAEGMLFLGKCVREQKLFGKTLISGDFEHNIPSVENGIAAPLKEVHGILKHLIWQSREVAKGDYCQRLDYFGELSDSFNSMVEQLGEREEALRRKNRELMSLQEMFQNITVDAPYYIFVLRSEDGAVTYLNKKAEDLKRNSPLLFETIYGRIARCHENMTISVENTSTAGRLNHYRVMTTSRPEDESAIYMVINVTDEFSKTLELEKFAYTDELTGLHNRRYAQELMQELRKNKIDFAIAFIDIDHLKYCNDVFGHEKGDEYIMEVSLFLRRLPGEKNVCRVGGDEFTVVMPSATKESLERELTEQTQFFMASHRQPFQKSFSYGVSELRASAPQTISDAVTLADQNMYAYKLTHRVKIEYEDQRLE